jgi:hypothetical protein
MKKKWKGKKVVEIKSEFREDVEVKKKVIDSNGSAGDAGDILTTTGDAIAWVDPAVAPATYTHTQAGADTTWTVNHNLNRKPSVTVVTSTEAVMIPDVFYNSLDQLTITLSNANSGKAYLN